MRGVKRGGGGSGHSRKNVVVWPFSKETDIFLIRPQRKAEFRCTNFFFGPRTTHPFLGKDVWHVGCVGVCGGGSGGVGTRPRYQIVWGGGGAGCVGWGVMGNMGLWDVGRPLRNAVVLRGCQSGVRLVRGTPWYASGEAAVARGDQQRHVARANPEPLVCGCTWVGLRVGVVGRGGGVHRRRRPTHP